MKLTAVILLISAGCYLPGSWDPVGIRYANHNGHQLEQGDSPTVRIMSPEDQATFAWSAQVPYSISVADPKDGESRYGEIKATETLLEVDYLPVSNQGDIKERITALQRVQESKGLTLMKTSTCFGCHGDKNRFAGPSFSDLANKYEPNAATLKTLGTHVLKGSSGIWGNLEMPSHPDFTLEEATQMAAYMLEEGKNTNHWVYRGLEGVVRIIEKPAGNSEGRYVLTASYTSKSKLRGHHSIVLNIK